MFYSIGFGRIFAFSCLFGLSLPANAQQSDPAFIASLLSPQGYVNAKISPDGAHVAVIAFNGFNHALIMLDTATMDSKIIGKAERVEEGFWILNRQPQDIIWIDNEVMAVDFGAQIEAMNLEGKKIALLAESLEGVQMIGKVEATQEQSVQVLVAYGTSEKKLTSIDPKTGKSSRLSTPDSGKLIDWAFDKHGQLRAVTMQNSSFWKETNSISNWYRKNALSAWEKLEEFKVTDDYWQPIFVPDQENSIVVTSRQGRNTHAIFRYDTQKRTLDEMMAGHPTEDIASITGLKQTFFESVSTQGLFRQTVWFDSDWSRIQATVDLALPNSVNRLSGNPKTKVLVYSYSDINPGSWYLLDVEKLQFTHFGNERSALDRKQMHKMSAFTYPAMDGTAIPAYLTHPSNSSVDDLVGNEKRQPLPLIVMIHGGPIHRDHWEWNSEVQLLSQEGYVVLQPQFRGSTGFGKNFETAGYGQWGLMMQDDITAGVKYLIEKGIADPNRVCIYGASFGGYAAMWGLIKTPELYRCGISFAGVSDIEYLFKDDSDSNESRVTKEIMRYTIGDLKLEKEKFDQVSPLKHVDQIQSPLFLVHGSNDRRVPISHSLKMKAAMEKNHKSVKWLELRNEGHGISHINSRGEFYRELLLFLKQYLKPDTGQKEPKASPP